MANYSVLLADIASAIYENHNNEIDALDLKGVLDEMVASLGDGYLIQKTLATPSTDPGTPDTNVAYFASQAGTYTNFGGIQVAAGEVALLCWDGSWTKLTTGAMSAGAIVDNLTTNDATKPLSAKQGKVLKDAQDATNEDVSALGHILDEESQDAIYTANTGYYISGSNKTTSANYSYSSPIHLNAGDILVTKLICQNANAISLTNSAGTSFSQLVGGASLIAVEYEYRATEDCYVAICWRSASASPEYVKIISSTLATIIYTLANETHLLSELQPIRNILESRLSSAGILVEGLTGQSYNVNVYDVRELVGKSIKVYGRTSGGGRVWSISKNGDFDNTDVIVKYSSANSIGWDLTESEEIISLTENCNYIAIVSYNSSATDKVRYCGSYLPVGEVVTSLRDSILADDYTIYLPKKIKYEERRIAASGCLSSRLNGQPYVVSVFDVRQLSGRTLTIKGDTSGGGRIWSSSTDDLFDDANNIIRVSAAQSTGWDWLQAEETIVVQEEEKYIAIVSEKRLESCKLPSNIFATTKELNEKANKEKIYDIVFWGDSITFGNQDNTGVDYPEECAKILGTPNYLNCGIGGETGNSIAFRQGGNSIIIPAGSVNGNYTDLFDVFGGNVRSNFYHQADKSNTVNPISINGHPAKIKWDSQNGYYTISGYDGGAADTPSLIRSNGSLINAKIAVICIGTNGYNTSPYGENSPINTQNPAIELSGIIIDSMISHLRNTNYILMSPVSYNQITENGVRRSYQEDDPVSPWWGTYEEALFKYGNHFFYTRQQMCKYGLTIAGITPTAQDLIDIAHNVIPTSLLYDHLHFNEHGYKALARLVSDKIIALGYDLLLK